MKLKTVSFKYHSECIAFIQKQGCQKLFTEILGELITNGYFIIGSYNVVYDPKEEYERVKRQIADKVKAVNLTKTEINLS